ncbi:unnamed protein product [Euphydryas editha]|uniref:Fatty acid hydroxylase domain-containing protein n=1 Tax=Euphydryas editha TaxID=104508 RepID=A0AAU9TMB5_EUPED|nr:unnamed protein product [Euphydryas editha]
MIISRLDWSKPLLSQLHKIAPDYQKWVNSAVFRKCRLFSNPILESMTFTPWYVVPLFWIPIILYLGVSQYFEHVHCEDCIEQGLTNLQFLQHMAAGLVIWTLLEYSLHRWVFHYDPGSSLKLIQLHFLIHGMHHKVPFDGLRQVFPPIPALMIASIIYVPLQCFLSYPLIKLTGGLIGYLIYDMIHYYVHHGSPNDGTYLYAMKRYHSNHHFVNHDKGNEGQSTIIKKMYS